MGKQVIQKDKTIIATFENTEVYDRYKHEIPSETLCLIKEKPISIDNSVQIFNGDSFNSGRGAWKDIMELSRPFTDFDKIIVQFCDENLNDIYFDVLDTMFLYLGLSTAIQTNKVWILAGKGQRYSTMKQSSTTSRFIPNWTNIYIRNIWGWKA